MTRFYTFNHLDKTSEQSHEHATIRFANGTISILSRDSTRSVQRKWDDVGMFGSYSTGHNWVDFAENSMATRMVATQLKRMGYLVFMVGRFDPNANEFGTVEVLESNGLTTNPESIKGRIRDRNPGNERDKRSKVQRMFGRMGKVDVTAMRAAILRRK